MYTVSPHQIHLFHLFWAMRCVSCPRPWQDLKITTGNGSGCKAWALSGQDSTFFELPWDFLGRFGKIIQFGSNLKYNDIHHLQDLDISYQRRHFNLKSPSAKLKGCFYIKVWELNRSAFSCSLWFAFEVGHLGRNALQFPSFSALFIEFMAIKLDSLNVVPWQKTTQFKGVAQQKTKQRKALEAWRFGDASCKKYLFSYCGLLQRFQRDS